MSSPTSSDPGVDNFWLRCFKGSVLRLVRLCAAGLTVCFILYYLAPYSRWAETTTHFVAFYALCGVVGAAAACGMRRWWLAGLCAVFAIFYFALIVPWYIPRPTYTGDTGTNLRIVTANLLSINAQKELFQQFVHETDPDVIFVQEYSPAWASALDWLKKDYPFHVERTRSDHFGIALFSRLPLEDEEVFYPASDRFPAIRAAVRVNDRTVTLLNLHPVPPLLSDLFAIRNRQLADAAQIVQKQDDLVVAAGDLNITMWSPYYRAFEANSGLQNTRRGFGIIPTWPANMPLAQLPLDHVFVSPEIETIDIRRGPDIGSDHLPMVADLVVPFN